MAECRTIPVDGRELSHERHDRSVCQSASRSAKLACTNQAAIDLAQEIQRIPTISANSLPFVIKTVINLTRTLTILDVHQRTYTKSH